MGYLQCSWELHVMVQLVANDPQQVASALEAVPSVPVDVHEEGGLEPVAPPPAKRRRADALQRPQEVRVAFPVLQLDPVAGVPQEGEPHLRAPEKGMLKHLCSPRPETTRSEIRSDPVGNKEMEQRKWHLFSGSRSSKMEKRWTASGMCSTKNRSTRLLIMFESRS